MTYDVHINHENIGYLCDANIKANAGLQTLQNDYFIAKNIDIPWRQFSNWLLLDITLAIFKVGGLLKWFLSHRMPVLRPTAGATQS